MGNQNSRNSNTNSKESEDDIADMKFENVVKSSIFLSEMDNFNEVNEVYGSYFENESAPARETVAVKTLPKNVRVEISMIAVK